MNFTTINVEKHREKLIKFRKDSFVVSFGESSGLGDENEYLNWVKIKVREFPNGFIMVEKENELIGQMELSVKKYEGRKIGYIHLYYLVPESRGNGTGKRLHEYALTFFAAQNLNEFHLRVSPSNTSALKFYKKIGLEVIGSELNGKLFRMKGSMS